MADNPASPPPPAAGILDDLLRFAKWCAANPVAALGLAAVTATLVFFYGFIHPFSNGAESAAIWAWRAWNPENNLEHGKFVPLISLYLAWYHRDELARAPKAGSNRGLLWAGIGILFFVVSVRCIQGRMALGAAPFLLYGIIEFLWGKKVARILLFPCAFLIFTIPFAAIEQATFRLQFAITGLVGFLTNIVGIGIQAIGTTLTATDGSFNFEIAEGCSGIRSLTAMTMLTAIYVHLTQDRFWKKIVILAGSVLFAIIGNAGRIFTVILVAKFYDPKIAGGGHGTGERREADFKGRR